MDYLLVAIAISIAFLVFTLFALFVKMIAESVGRSEKDVEQEGVTLPKRASWSIEETLLVAYIAFNYKTSNTHLIHYVSNALGRKKSSVVRKINRLRATQTDKCPYASNLDKSCSNYMVQLASREKGKETFFEALKDACGICGEELGKIDILLQNSTKIA